MEEEINLLDYYFVLKKRWKVIFYLFIVTVITSIIISFQLPKIYQAKATIFITQEQRGISSIISQIPIALPGISSAGGSDYIVVLLQSDALKEKVIEKLKLNVDEIFVGKSKEKITRNKLLKKIKDITKIEDNKKGSITIKVDTTNRYLSAKIANCYVKILDKSIKTVATTNKDFLEKRIKEVKENLTKSENELKSFQEKNKAISIDKQAEGLISTYVDLEAQKIASQIQLQQVNAVSRVTGSMEDLVKLETEKVALQTRQRGLERNISNLERDLQVIPKQSLQLVRLMREVKLQSMIFETLLQQYELAKIEEIKDYAKFQIIDRAYPPDKHYKPSKRMTVMMAGLLSLFIGIFLVFFLEYLENIKNLQRKM